MNAPAQEGHTRPWDICLVRKSSSLELIMMKYIPRRKHCPLNHYCKVTSSVQVFKHHQVEVESTKL